MKQIITILALLVLITPAAHAEDLKKLSLDDVSSLGLQIRTDSEVKVEGKASIRITTQWPATVCLGEVTDLDLENGKLIYQARVKSDLDGSAFLELWAHVGDGQYFSKGMNDPIEGRSEWKSIRTPFLFQKGQNPDKVTLNLVINGKGTVWVDDIVLSREPLD
jgi:hypothetical protein